MMGRDRKVAELGNQQPESGGAAEILWTAA